MSLTDFQTFVTYAEGGTQYQVWAKDNPGELARWSAYRDQILAGQSPAPVAMLTPHGRELIQAGVIYLQTVPAAAPPPPAGVSLPLLLGGSR